MAAVFNAYTLLRVYASKMQKHDFDFPSFASFSSKYFEQYKKHHPELDILWDSSSSAVAAELEDLEKRGACALEYIDDAIARILFPQYYFDILAKHYKEMEKSIELPFVDAEAVKIPEDLVRVVNISGDLVNYLKAGKAERPEILRLVFPGEIKNVLISSSAATGHKLIQYAVDKIRLYLNTKKNYEYARNRLLPVFPKREAFLKEMLDAILIKPASAVGSIVKPSLGTYNFWTHLSVLIIQEYEPRTEKLEIDHAYLQAAYLINHINMFNKQTVQEETEIRECLKNLDACLKLPPFVFTQSDMFGFKLKNGEPVLKQSTYPALTEHLEAQTKVKEGASLPVLMKFRSADKKDCYIHKTNILPYCIKGIFAFSQNLKKELTEEWVREVKAGRHPDAMVKDEVFLSLILERFAARQPALMSLLRYEVIFLARKEGGDNPTMVKQSEWLIDRKREALRPFTEIVGLTREEVVKEVNLFLPIWETVPILKWLSKAFKALFGPSPKKKKKEPAGAANAAPASADAPDAAKVGAKTFRSETDDEPETPRSGTVTSKTRLAAFKKEVEKLKTHLLGGQADLDATLEELIERWNPIFEPKARKALTEDVNALTRDYLRGIQRSISVRAPDIDRIKNLARQIAHHKNLERIRRMESLERYVELYIVKSLLERTR